MRIFLIKAAGLLAALPGLSAVLHYLILGRLFLACFFAYVSWACYSVVVMFLAIRCGLGSSREAEKQQKTD